MLKKLSLVILFVIIAGCSKFEFVHQKNLNTNQITNRTTVYVDGDNIPILKTELKNILGSPNELIFELSVSSKEEIINLVKEIDMTASLIQIKQTTTYELRLVEKSCIIARKTISNNRKFNSKAEGYNFGSDLSKKEIKESLVKENIRQYLNFISTNILVLDC